MRTSEDDYRALAVQAAALLSRPDARPEEAAAWAPPGRAVAVDWRAGAAQTEAPGPVAQALGNLVSNAAEHGDGQIGIRAVRTERAVRVEVTNAPASTALTRGGGGRGLRIAGRAARSAAGRLSVVGEDGRVTAALELPAER